MLSCTHEQLIALLPSCSAHHALCSFLTKNDDDNDDKSKFSNNISAYVLAEFECRVFLVKISYPFLENKINYLFPTTTEQWYTS